MILLFTDCQNIALNGVFSLLTDYVDLDTFSRICGHMCHENALAVQVSLETGLRIGDVVSLPVTALQGCYIFFTASKTGKSGKKKISSALAKRLREISGKKYIFEGRNSSDKHRTRQAVWHDIKLASALCGCTVNVAPHSARKTYAVEQFHRGGLGAVRRELQHEDYGTTMLYALSDKLTCTPQTVNSNSPTGEQLEALAQRIAELVVEKMKPLR